MTPAEQIESLKPTVKTGADLVSALVQTGTPDNLLTTARELLAEKKHASPAEVLAAIQAHPDAQLGTIKKALTLCDAIVADAEDPTAFPVRAPEDGCTVGGKAYPAGAAIPPDELAKATPDESLLLRRTGPAVDATEPATHSELPPSHPVKDKLAGLRSKSKS